MTVVGIQMIRIQDFEETARAADAGTEQAREFLQAFLHWDKHFQYTDERPRCFSCTKVIHRLEDLDDDDPGNLGGFGFAKLSEDGAKEIEGFGCPFCLDCTRKGAQRLSKQFSRLMERQLGLVAVQVH
jgi:hypothetical protein